MNTEVEKPLEVYEQPTPNPNAFKFILNKTVKTEGSSSYQSPTESIHNHLATHLFMIRGVSQIHFGQNFITVTKFDYEDWDIIIPEAIRTMKEQFARHNPEYSDPNPEEERKKNLTPEMAKIEAILDKTVRPGLQGDGGDLQIVDFTNNVLIIKYEGACGTCPSSQQGTLEAIRQILRDQYDQDIEVYSSL